MRVIPGRVCVRGVVGMHFAGSASPALCGVGVAEVDWNVLP